MIQAIIFDCYGVLVRDGWIPFRERHFGDNQQLMQQAIDANRKVDAGLSSYADFIAEAAELAKISAEQARREIETNPRNTELFDIIRSLKPDYKLGVLSNAASDIMNELFTPEQAGLFDEVVVSYMIGAIKPDPRAYRMAAERLGVELSQCLFIDDQPHYCEGARAVGMDAIWYQDNIQLKEEFKKRDISTLQANNQ